MNTLQITTPHWLSEFQIEKGEHVALTFRLLNASKLENELGSKVLSYLTGQCLSDLYPTICRYQGCIDQIDLYEIVVTWQRSTSIDFSNVVSFFFESVEILGQHAYRYKREFNAVPVWVGFVCVYDNEPKQTESINLPIRLPSFEFFGSFRYSFV